MDWADPAAIGYPALGIGVLVGSIVPVVPTGAVVGAAAAIAMTTDHLWLPFVIALAAAAALVGDLVTFAVARAGSAAAVRWVARGQLPERLDSVRAQFGTRGWQLIVIGRLVPAGRIPVLLAAGALEYPWRRLVPATAAACVLWAGAYAVLGVVSGGLFDNPLVASLIAAALVLLVGAVTALVSRWRARRKAEVSGAAR
ncbi:DedA family protein [Pseudonocardia sp. GCM10023141]|uniref:DedA family protein n=1 Tax=Pseudonocardia sp. GCM10023141 TaxID=3252653 RepID=UPI003617821D